MKKAIKTNNEISELCSFSLGKYQQKVLIEGKNKDNPVVITLHGGPGKPIPFSVGCRGLFPMFTDDFIMVYWDQLGCGINNYLIDDSFSIDTFVSMTAELIEKIKNKFPNNQIIVLSTSWGSILSAKLLEKNPYAVDCVIAYGQIIKDVFICDEVKETLAKTNISAKKLNRIKNLTSDNFQVQDLLLITNALQKYTDAYQNKLGEKVPMGSILKGLLKSPDYKIQDFIATIVNGYMKNSSLWKEIVKINLEDQLRNVKVPYIMLQGDTDIVASTKTVKELVIDSNNPYLDCKIVSNTGHMPSAKMINTILTVLKEYKLKTQL